MPDAGHVRRDRSGHAARLGRGQSPSTSRMRSTSSSPAPATPPAARDAACASFASFIDQGNDRRSRYELHRQASGGRRSSSRPQDPTLRQTCPPKPERRSAEGRRRMIRIENLHKRFGEVRAVDGVIVHRRRRPGHRPARPQRRRQDHDAPHALHADATGRGHRSSSTISMPSPIRRARGFALGVLPDQSGLYPRLTAREHIEYFGELQGITGADLRSRTDHLLKMLDMTAIADRRVAGFSHGERTKTALARAIVHNPKNVLLDEPTNGLDVMSTRAVREIIRRLKERRTHGAVLQPRDAGSLRALRHDRRDRARQDRRPRDRRMICARRPDTESRGRVCGTRAASERGGGRLHEDRHRLPRRSSSCARSCATGRAIGDRSSPCWSARCSRPASSSSCSTAWPAASGRSKTSASRSSAPPTRRRSSTGCGSRPASTIVEGPADAEEAVRTRREDVGAS